MILTGYVWKLSLTEKWPFFSGPLNFWRYSMDFIETRCDGYPSYTGFLQHAMRISVYMTSKANIAYGNLGGAFPV